MATDEAPAHVARVEGAQLGVDPVWTQMPGAVSLVVRHDAERHARVVSEMRWGLQREDGRLQLHVRAETITARGQLYEALRSRRVIVPMDAYAQRATRGIAVGQEFAVTLKEGAPLAVAGLWSKDDTGPAFCAITCSANAAIAPIHDRMPVILSPAQWRRWLGAGLTPGEAAALLAPCPAEWLVVRPLDRRYPRPEPKGEKRAEQLRLLGLDADAITPVQPSRRRAAALRRTGEVRRGLG